RASFAEPPPPKWLRRPGVATKAESGFAQAGRLLRPRWTWLRRSKTSASRRRAGLFEHPAQVLLFVGFLWRNQN
ncbi:MAG: hypothetical protein V3S85_00395, partial [Nitrospirales bacterium]